MHNGKKCFLNFHGNIHKIGVVLVEIDHNIYSTSLLRYGTLTNYANKFPEI